MPDRSPHSLLDQVTVHCAADIRRAAEALHTAALSLARLRTAACANIASKEPMVDEQGALLATEVFGWTGAGLHWWENPRLALTSPLTIACRYESEPFWCNKDGVHARQANPHLAELDLGDFFRRAMTEAAIVVPVHLPFGQIGVVSFSPAEAGRTDLAAEFDAHADILELYARKFICGYVKVMNKQRCIQPDVRLSKREVECLRWAALGKTDQEIATIISRSSATIRFHIHNAAMKLDAVNRSQAVFKASQLGYLGAVA
jgi:DNA-binding CsgD family transcriptional regulator